ncbi:TetR/AcrR family transcriptional regulator [Neisseriaceae bacterium B1]
MTDSRTQFILAGLALYPDLGYHKLSVRALATQAGLSAGMFHHLFEDKDDFMRQMFEQHHQNIASRLNADVFTQNRLPEQQLRQALAFLARSVRENGMWLRRMLADCENGAASVQDFLRTHSQNHFDIVGQLLRTCLPQCDEQEILLRLNYLMCTTAAPILFTAQFAQMGILPANVSNALPEYMCDEAIERRLDWALAAVLSP